MNSDFTENLFQSIDTIVSARLANLPYDQTIECEVINTDEDWDGKYIVKYQASTFTAKGTPKAYKVDDIVYVQIPKADFTQEKFIINKKTDVESQSIKRLPFLTFAKNDNIFPPVISNREYQLKVRGDGLRTEEAIYTFRNFYGESQAAGYTKLGLKTSMKLNIPYETISGDYGIKIEVRGFDQNSTYLSADSALDILEKKEFIFSTKDMISSNYYNTLGYCNQEKVFDIEDFVIFDITVSVWQNGNFLKENKEAINNAKIYFTNFSLYLGYDLSEFKSSKYKNFLYTTSGYKYNDNYYNKTIQLRFVELINKTDISVITANLDDSKYTIYWEEYDPNIKTNGPQSNIISFRNLQENNIGGITKNQIFTEWASRLRYSFVCIITDTLNNKYISNRLDFVRDTYLTEESLLELLTSFFRIDEHGKVYLNGGANRNRENGLTGLNISNVIFNDNYMASSANLILNGNFTIKDSTGKSILRIRGDNGAIQLLANPIITEIEEN